jgi:hypothetical protein
MAQATFEKTFGGPDVDRGIFVNLTADGGFIVAGFTRSIGAGEEDIYLLKLDSAGELQWSKTYGGKETDNGWSVHELAEGGYIIGGFTGSFGNGGLDLYLLKINSTGELTK